MPSPWVIALEIVIGYGLGFLLWKWIPVAIGRARDVDPWEGWTRR